MLLYAIVVVCVCVGEPPPLPSVLSTGASVLRAFGALVVTGGSPSMLHVRQQSEGKCVEPQSQPRLRYHANNLFYLEKAKGVTVSLQ